MNNFLKKIEAKEQRKIRAKKEKDIPLWKTIGTFGMVGWSISIPTIAGATIGRWLDTQYTDTRSWTLMLLLIGLFMGCWNAWYWISRESKSDEDIHE